MKHFILIRGGVVQNVTVVADKDADRMREHLSAQFDHVVSVDEFDDRPDAGWDHSIDRSGQHSFAERVIEPPLTEEPPAISVLRAIIANLAITPKERAKLDEQLRAPDTRRSARTIVLKTAIAVEKVDK